MRSTRFQYVHLSRRRNPITVAYVATESDGYIHINMGLAFCHSYDRFIRSLGREIAEGRLNTSPIYINTPFDSADTSSYGAVIADTIQQFVSDNYHTLSNSMRRNELE
jgi:hypothetical protein